MRVEGSNIDQASPPLNDEGDMMIRRTRPTTSLLIQYRRSLQPFPVGSSGGGPVRCRVRPVVGRGVPAHIIAQGDLVVYVTAVSPAPLHNCCVRDTSEHAREETSH